MKTTPWTSISTPIPGESYLALISYLPLRHFRAIPSFFRFTFQTQAQLKMAAGPTGYSLDAKPFSRKFWTLSVCEDQQSLDNFVGQAPHSQIMQVLAPTWTNPGRTMERH